MGFCLSKEKCEKSVLSKSIQYPSTNPKSKKSFKQIQKTISNKPISQHLLNINLTQSTKSDERRNIDMNMLFTMQRFVDETVAKSIKGLKKEFNQIAQSKKSNTKAFEKNQTKNRYLNIPCFDSSRVVLNYQSPPETDYIHANRVKSNIATLDSEFICTQAPTAGTTNDFWRMVWQEKPKFIVMLCRLLENKRPKCALYWPEKQGQTKKYGTVTVTNVGVIGNNSETVFDTEKFQVCVGSDEITVHHIRWLDWPDFGIPKSGLGMLRILRLIENDKGKAIVHCSAGIGRTGTLMAAEITVKALTAGKRVSIPAVIDELRKQRSGMLQTSSQYVYLHFSIVTYCERKLENFPEAEQQLSKLKRFFADYKQFAADEEKEDMKLAQKGLNVRNATNVVGR